MALSPKAAPIRLVDPEPEPNPFDPVTVDLPKDEVAPGVRFEDGAAVIEKPDGTVVVDFNPDRSNPDRVVTEGFFDNLANEIDDGRLSTLGATLYEGIASDEQSRRDWLNTRERGIALLGLQLEVPRSGLETSAPLEGMSTVRHPLLLEAIVRFQATARGELLPATGPVKVRNDAPPKPLPSAAAVPPPTLPQGPAGTSPQQPGAPPLQQAPDKLDDLASALETDMNHFLTVTASEYVPDTDRMLFGVGFGGDGFKKVYNCPLRRRQVSESVTAQDLIISNTATDIRNCGRVTHVIKMRPSTLRRMQISGHYRDVSLAPPQVESPNPVEKKEAEISGVKPPQRPEDQDYVIYECYCEADLDQFAPSQFKGKGVPLPYCVTLEKVSRQVLAVRRNWAEDDEQCLPKQFFVQFPFIRGLGFYGLGFIHLLGNTTVALTALWREFIDSGMFANFPGFIYAKGLGRQLTNQIRIPPGGGFAIDIPPNMPINQAVMPVPYKEPGAATQQFAQHVEEVGQRLGQTAEIGVGEGKQDTPVGTIMAIIEQATKVIDAVHKRLHTAQAEEFGLLKERFREDPEGFWRHSKGQMYAWTKEQFIEALNKYELVPVADPNNPTSLHRIAKAVILDTMVSKYPMFHDVGAVLRRIYRIGGIDAEGLLKDQPDPPAPDPRMMAIQAKERAENLKNQIAWIEAQIKASESQARTQGQAQDQATKERLGYLKLVESLLKIQQEQIIHAADMQRANEGHFTDLFHGLTDHLQSLGHEQDVHEQELARDQRQHEQSLAQDRDHHMQDMQHGNERHAADVAHKREMTRIAAAAARAKPKTGGS